MNPLALLRPLACRSELTATTVTPPRASLDASITGAVGKRWWLSLSLSTHTHTHTHKHAAARVGFTQSEPLPFF